MKLRDNKFILEEEVNAEEQNLQNILERPSIFATSYQTLPYNIDENNFNKKLTSHYTRDRSKLPSKWRCQTGDIVLDQNKLIESEYRECNSYNNAE